MEATETIRVGIAGVRGYTGVEVARLLARHDRFRLVTASSDALAGSRLAKLDPAVAPMEVRVRPNGDLSLVDRSKSPDELRVNRRRLLELVREAQRANPGQAVVVAGDRNARYEEVLQVLDLLQRSQVKRVGLLARPAPGP